MSLRSYSESCDVSVSKWSPSNYDVHRIAHSTGQRRIELIRDGRSVAYPVLPYNRRAVLNLQNRTRKVWRAWYIGYVKCRACDCRNGCRYIPWSGISRWYSCPVIWCVVCHVCLILQKRPEEFDDQIGFFPYLFVHLPVAWAENPHEYPSLSGEAR